MHLDSKLTEEVDWPESRRSVTVNTLNIRIRLFSIHKNPSDILPMPVLLRKLLIALHLTVTLCGASLHSIPGWEHGSGVFGNDCGGEVRGLPKGIHLADDDCSVCHLLSLGQLPVDLDGGPIIQIVGCVAPVDLPPIRASLAHRPTSPRAPPQLI